MRSFLAASLVLQSPAVKNFSLVPKRLLRTSAFALVLTGGLSAELAHADGGAGGCSPQECTGAIGGTPDSTAGWDGMPSAGGVGGAGAGGGSVDTTTGIGGNGGIGGAGVAGGGGGGSGAAGQAGSGGAGGSGLAGGTGGAGGQNPSAAPEIPQSGAGGGGGGGGGAGVILNGAATNSANIDGGSGGNGGGGGGSSANGTGGGGSGGGGGEGGTGVQLNNSAPFTNAGTVSGGAGGNGGGAGSPNGTGDGTSITAGGGGQGGRGGNGLTANNGADIQNAAGAQIVGGRGANGGGAGSATATGPNITAIGGNGGDAGVGGIGVFLSGNSTITNSGGILGGDGGAGENGGYGSSTGDVVSGGGGVGGNGGAGVSIDGSGTLINALNATIQGGNGGTGGGGSTLNQSGTGNIAGGAGANGGAGGAGVIVTGSGNVSNAGTIIGGLGNRSGGGSNATGGGVAGDAGAGGDGVLLRGGGTVTNSASGLIQGGEGGSDSVGGGGGGGIGGNGVSLVNGGNVTNEGQLLGGEGGDGANANLANGAGGKGSEGGNGVLITGNGLVTNAANATITGGNGGTGGGSQGTGLGGMGGAGGAGVEITQGGTISNAGIVTGGSGNRGGGGGGAAGGSGGAGIDVSGGGAVDNTGNVTGGNGGEGGTAGDGGGTGTAGDGGVGITGQDVAIVNSGEISGGLSGTGTRADAIIFTGGTNSLELRAGSTIDGIVDATAGTATLILGGATNSSFDTSLIGSATQYRGFSEFYKTGTSSWILTGTTSQVTPWTLFDGILNVSAAESLGASGSALTFNGGTLQLGASLSLDTTRPVTLGPAGGTIDTDGFDGEIAGVVSGPGALTKQGVGILVLTGENTYSGGTSIENGVLQLGKGGPSGSISGDIANNGSLVFNRSNALTIGGSISGTGNVRQIGTGTTLLNGPSSYSGSTTVEAGTLAAGGENYFSALSDFTVSRNATLALNDHNQSLKSLGNSGSVNFGSNAGTVLSVAGNYTTDGGILQLATVLGGDSSLTDKLVVNGDTSGTGILAVRNAGGAGAQTNEGIKIVDIAGASNATFTLRGDYEFQGAPAVVGGAYAYQLYKNGKADPNDGDWYLRSTIRNPTNSGGTNGGSEEIPLYQPGVPSYEAYPQLLLGLNSLPTLQQRVGNRYWSNAGNIMLAEGADPVGSPYAPVEEAGSLIEGNGIWGRVEGAHTKADPSFSTSGTDYSFNTFKLQAGIDGMLAETENGKLIGGITVHYAHGKAKTRSLYGDGEISTNGYGFGGTLTWYDDNGFYLDGQAQVTWYDSDLMSDLANLGLADGNNGFGYAFSAETGKRITINQSWSVTPQAQLTYSNVDFDSFNDVFDARTSLDSGESLQGRIGVAVEHQNSWYNANGLIDRTYLYGIANLYYEFLDGTKVDVSGTSFASRNERLWGGIGLGGSYNWNSDKYSIYGEGSVNTSLENFADSYSYKGTLGFRVKW